jgi:hypothetical protein
MKTKSTQKQIQPTPIKPTGVQITRPLKELMKEPSHKPDIPPPKLNRYGIPPPPGNWDEQLPSPIPPPRLLNLPPTRISPPTSRPPSRPSSPSTSHSSDSSESNGDHPI